MKVSLLVLLLHKVSAFTAQSLVKYPWSLIHLLHKVTADRVLLRIFV
jgi:hypothetical protein